MFIGRTDVEAETPILWPPDVKSWLIWKDPDSEKDWEQEEKGQTEDEMVGWHHQLNGHEFGWTLGVGDGQGGLACCGSQGRKESDTTERLKWTELHMLGLQWKLKLCLDLCFLSLMIWLVLNYLSGFNYNSNSDINFVQKDWFPSYHLPIFKLHVHVCS